MGHNSIVYQRETGAIVQKTSSMSVLQPRDVAKGLVLLHLPAHLSRILLVEHTHVRLSNGEAVGFHAVGGGFGGSAISHTQPLVPDGKASKIAVSALGDVILSLPAAEEYARTLDGGITYITDGQMVEFLSRIPFVARAVSGLRARYAPGRYINLGTLGEAVPPSERLPRPEQYADILGVTLSLTSMPNYLTSGPEELAWASSVVENLPRPIVMVSPFTGSTLKEWRKERDLMAAMPDVTFLMVGKKSASTGLDNVVSLGGRTTVTSLMSLMTLCDAGGFLDTGLMHVAGMVGTPYVAVFGGVHPPVEFTSLYDTVHTLSSRDHRAVTDMSTSDCSPCYLGKSGSCLGTEHERWCMRSIEIDEVGTKLREVLDGNGRRGPSKWSTPKGRPRKATKSVAVVCVGGFGDTLVALNTLRELSPKLRESYPSAEIDFVVRDDYRALKDLPWFDNWRAVSGGTTQAKSMEWCQSNYDLTIELKHGNPKSDPFGPDPIALVQSRNLGDLSFTPDGGTLTHHLDVLSPGRAEVARLSRVLPPEGEYVVLANGTDVTLGNLTKAVGGKFFGDLGRLIAEAGLTPVVVGVKGAGAVAIPGALDLVGKTSLGGLASVLRGARGVVSIDNGVVHLASQIGVPCVVLFGPTSAAFWGYEFNLNVTPEPNTCSEAPCWLTTRDWHTACKVDPMSTGTPACMGSYDAARIWALAGRYLEDRQLGGVVASS